MALPTMAAGFNAAPDHSDYGWVLDGAKKNADGTVSVKIMEVPRRMLCSKSMYRF